MNVDKLSIYDFRKYLTTMQPGDRVIYHRGNLAFDRANPRNKDRDMVHQRALVVSEAAKAGIVTPLQRPVLKDMSIKTDQKTKLGDPIYRCIRRGSFDYIVQRRNLLIHTTKGQR